MSNAWSWYVIVLVVINILGCVWLLRGTSKSKTGAGADNTTGHVWDGISEYTKPLPRWWIILFYLTIVFAIGYLVWYPGMGNLAGKGGWTSAGEHDAAVAAADAKLAPLFARFEGKPVAELARDPQALALGKSIFANNCVACHGSDARGAKGFPNLTDADWQWGGDPDTVLTTILFGRTAAMPPMGPVLGSDQAVTEVAVYVQSLSGQQADPALAVAGKARFDTICAACHQPTGTGNPLLGAPNLTDGIWLYGGDVDSIRTTINQGRQGQMPAHQPLLGETRVRLVAAWVYAQAQSLNHPAGAP